MGEGINTDMQGAALDLAAREFRVFPLIAGKKDPAFAGWQVSATTDPDRIRQWWSDQNVVIGFTRDGREVISNPAYNVGVATGGGLLGVDADIKKGHRGIESARALGVRFDGLVVRTPSGGLHEYFRGPDVTNSAGVLGDGLDIRSAGGFLVGPGSVVDGQVYTIEAANDLQPAPTALVHRLLQVRDDRVRADGPTVTPDTVDAVERGLVYLGQQAPLAVEGAGGDHTTFTVAAKLKDFGISEDMASDLMAEHWNDRCSPPWDIDELKGKIRNAYEYGDRPIGDLHPAADFAGVRIEPPEPAPVVTPSRSHWFHHGDGIGRVDWLFYQMLPKTGVGVLLAPSQAGKTFLAIHLAYSLATGQPFFQETPDDLGATLFLFAGTEGSGLALRLDALGHEVPLPISARVVGNLSDKDALPALLDDLKQEAARLDLLFGVPVRLIVLETMAASGLLADENDNSEASRAMANLATISREMNALVLTSHHPAKDGKGSRGASAIPSAADYVMEIQRDGQSQLREAVLTKARDAEQRKLGTFTLLPVDLGKDDRGRPITSMTVSTGDVMSNATRAAPHADKLVEALEWALIEDGEDLGDGRKGVEMSIARDVFAERKGGSRDRSNLLKSFKQAVGWLENIGRVEVVGVGADKFLVLKTVSMEMAA